MRLPNLTVQQRISFAVALLVATALVVTGFTVYLIESRRVDAAVESSIANEMAGFRKYSPEETVDTRLTSYLESSFPPHGSVLWAFKSDDTIAFVGPDASTLQADGNFPVEVRKRINSGGVFDFSAGGTHYRIGILPIHADDQRAALVVTVDTGLARAELRELMITFGLLAAISLMVVVSLSNLIAARALAPLRQLSDTAKKVSEGTLGDRIVITGKDDLADLQLTFNTMLDRIEAAMRAQKDMLDDAAHELRTPLTIIRGHIELLDPTDPEDAQATRAIVTEEIDRMGRLVSDLLILAKTDRRDFVKREAVEVGGLLQSVLDRMAPLHERQWAIDEGLDETAQLDEQRIIQALVQLVDNAVKHTDRQDVIALGAKRIGTEIEFWVRDTGSGVDESKRDVIFERFGQADSESEGFGLGLTIVSAIAAAHGGQLALDPAVEGVRGSTFRFRIDAGETT